MTREHNHAVTEPDRADYDSPWKKALEVYFKEFIDFFFPEMAADLDWSHEHEAGSMGLDAMSEDSKTKGKLFRFQDLEIWKKAIEIGNTWVKRFNVHGSRLKSPWPRPGLHGHQNHLGMSRQGRPNCLLAKE